MRIRRAAVVTHFPRAKRLAGGPLTTLCGRIDPRDYTTFIVDVTCVACRRFNLKNALEAYAASSSTIPAPSEDMVRAYTLQTPNGLKLEGGVSTDTLNDPSPRPVADAMVKTMMHIVQESANINNTGKTWEQIEREAALVLYRALDAVVER